MQITITDSVKYIGVDDKTLDLFENQYQTPNGISYNSYVILDEKIAVLDTVDKRGEEEWEENLLRTLEGRKPDYLIIHHLEPDHSGSFLRFLELFPEVTVVGSEKMFQMLPQFFTCDVTDRKLVVKEGDTLSLGTHELLFLMAPMVHWPEVMVSYEKTEKLLFSADAFGKFGALELTQNEGWAHEARRYYFNIVGKYGALVQKLLKKLEPLDIQKICPLHGPVIEENRKNFIRLYDIWSSYRPENEGIVIAYASIHGNTAKAAKELAEILKKKGAPKVMLYDLAREEMSKVIEAAFRYDRMILAAASYDGGVFPCMQDFLHHLQSKSFQKRKIGLLENGSWSASAACEMLCILKSMKDLEIVQPIVTICSTLKESDYEKLEILAESML